MSTWREIKAKALGRVHARFKVPAVYWTHSAGTPLAVNIRIHTKQEVINNDFTWPSTPGFLDLSPKIIFDTAELSKALHDAYVFVSATEVYLIGPSKPTKDGYFSADVVDASADGIAAMLGVLDMGNLDPVWEGVLP